MTQLTKTQILILTAGAQRPGYIAVPLPKRLHGAAAKMAVSKMIERGLLEEVDANIRKGEPLWRETGGGYGTTLRVTNFGQAAIGIVPERGTQINHPPPSDANSAPFAPRMGTKQAQLVALLEAPEGATMKILIAATGWQAHTLRGAMSGALGKRLGLTVTSTKEEGRARIYRIRRNAV
ncbi:DUF3489 domain-containing protein [Pseudorhodobacter turbinis]|uniref:DUF3489 domain-containing protein n=1 Tax=Pseudorhodobacter turbinis TaxID=2500533 RepID=A0A4P8EFL9_9RHOB|nr:DUF3489 domain-containing protein [Pseudorhodobacter turbinis]QCO55569.1 DUF3489 domain-containing protein [Pseudorhodobacter turbinis]